MHNGFSPSRRAWNRVMTVLVWAAALLVISKKSIDFFLIPFRSICNIYSFYNVYIGLTY